MKDKKNLLILSLLSLLYFASRLINLKIIPIFTDEAIYTYWSQVALNDPAQRFISLEDGKQPLFIWLAAISQNFISEPLVASRLVSVFAGFGALIAVYLLSKKLLGEKVALFSALLYLVLPFTLLYDRMALFDSLLTMLGLWAVYFSVRVAKELRLDMAILAGFAIGLAQITKSSGNFFLYLLPFSLLLSDTGDFRKKLLRWLPLALIAFLLSLAIYNSLRLSQLFYIIARKNLEFIRSFQEVLFGPFLFFVPNFRSLIDWSIQYMGSAIFIAFVAGLIFGFLRRNRQIIFLAILIFAPFGAEIFFNKVLYARFILFYFPYMIIIAAFALSAILETLKARTIAAGIIVGALLLFPIINSIKLLTNPPSATIPSNDSNQYLNDWPAGGGVDQIVTFLRSEKQKGLPVYVGTEGTFGLLPYAFKIYFFEDNLVQIDGFWPVSTDKIPDQVIEAAKTKKTFFVFNQNQKEITDPHLTFIASYRKGKGNSFMRLYEVRSP